MIHSLATEHLSRLSGDRTQPTMVEGKFTIGFKTKRRGGRYSLLIADSGERTYQGSYYYTPSGD